VYAQHSHGGPQEAVDSAIAALHEHETAQGPMVPDVDDAATSDGVGDEMNQ
jgi:hypothetical protein